MKFWQVFGPVLAVAIVIWLLAFMSHEQGNTTAINALVGIPMGLLAGAAFLYVLTKE